MADEEELPSEAGGAGNRHNGSRGDGVGYRRPPRKNQFQPGQSGNPRGRPKGAKGLKAELRAQLDEWVTITVDGKQKRVRKRRLVIKALAAKAAKGNVAAADKLLSLVIQAEGFEDERAASNPLSSTDLLLIEQLLGESSTGLEHSGCTDDATDGPGQAPPTAPGGSDV